MCSILPEIVLQIFTLLPMPTRIGPLTGYDTSSLDKVACVCKEWRDLCYSKQEGSPYIQLFRRQFSKGAPFPLRQRDRLADGAVRKSYLNIVGRCLGFTQEALKNAIESDYELAVAANLRVDEINQEILIGQIKYGVQRCDKGTPLALAIHNDALRVINLLFEYDNVDYENVVSYTERWEGSIEKEITDSKGHVSALDMAIVEQLHDLDMHDQDSKVLRLLLAHPKIKIGNSFNFSSRLPLKVFIGETCADLIAEKEPLALIPLLEAAAILIERSAIKKILSHIKNLGFATFGQQFYYHLLCIAGDYELKHHLSSIDFSWRDDSNHTILDIALKYQHIHLIELLNQAHYIKYKSQ